MRSENKGGSDTGLRFKQKREVRINLIRNGEKRGEKKRDLGQWRRGLVKGAGGGMEDKQVG